MTDRPRRPRVAAFRPDDGRADAAARQLERLGAEPVIDPMVELQPTGAVPRTNASFVILTSPAAADILAEGGWEPSDTTICAVGDATASALEAAGYSVDIVPETYSSTGLVNVLADRVEGKSVEVARSDHGSPVLTDGLADAGAIVHETILYELVRPEDAGQSVTLAAEGELDAVLFTSALTGSHFVETAAERGLQTAVRDGLGTAIVGTIGEPTRDRVTTAGIAVDLVASRADFEVLAESVMERLSADADR